MEERRKVTVGDPVLSTEFETTIGDGDKVRMEQTLLYLGQDGTRFTLGYREIGDGRAREPFHENATYQNPEPGDSTEVTYRRARLKVYAVSNAEIDFEVLSGNERI